jgi:hypothetical protein
MIGFLRFRLTGAPPLLSGVVWRSDFLQQENP